MYDIFVPIKKYDKTAQLNELPPYLRESIDAYVIGEKKAKNGNYLGYDNDFCLLQSNINIAETSGEITTEQAWALRHNILGIENKI